MKPIYRLCWTVLVMMWCTTAVLGLEPPTLYSKTAIVIEANSGRVLYEKNPDKVMHPASMTKVMTTYITMEEIQGGRLSYDTPILVTAEHEQLSSGEVYFPGYAKTLLAGNYETVDTLLHLIFQQSASAPCVMLAEYIAGTEDAFVLRMNQTAEALGMEAIYENCHGAYPHYLTARAQARLAQVAIQRFPAILDYAGLSSYYHRGTTYSVVSQLINKESNYYLPEVTGLKIGATTESGKCLTTTIDREGVTLIVVTFNAETLTQCYQDQHNLINYGYALWNEDARPFVDDIYEADSLAQYTVFLQEGINVQAQDGSVRPEEIMTYGDFAVTLVTALETVGCLTPPLSLPEVEGSEGYAYGDILLRGVSYGILPQDTLSPHAPILQGEMIQLFQRVRAILFPQEDIVTSYDQWAVEGGGTMLRREALKYIVSFLHDCGEMTHIPSDIPLLSEDVVVLSPWAETLVSTAQAEGIVPSTWGQNYTRAITRLELAQLLVQLVESTNGTALPVLDMDPFQDTQDPSVEKAVWLNLVTGISATQFAPYSLATRQEIAVMFHQGILALEGMTQRSLIASGQSVTLYQDFPLVASWAITPVTYLLEYGIMTGTSQTTFSPLDTATIEQCITIALLLFQDSQWQ